MLRALAANRRLLPFGCKKGSHCFSQSNQKPNYSLVRNHGLLVANAGFASPLCRVFSHYKTHARAHDLIGRNIISENIQRSNYAKSFHAHSVASPFTNHHARLAWERLNLICSCKGPNLNPISRMARAVSLTFTRFQVVPGILALTIGELALAQNTWADGDCFSRMDGLFPRVQYRHTNFAHSILESIIVLFRALYLTFLFLPAIAMAPFADTFGIQFRKAWLNLVHHTLEMAGPAFIKWGQWAATRPDLFPKDLCAELAKLHTKSPEHSFSYSKHTIEKAFGRKLSDIFDSFEETPVASGSIAQVHRASLRFRYPGQRLRKPIEVAVKVRHPGVGESIKRDYIIINFAARISKIIPALNWLRLDESVRQFAVFMMSQVDLAREAAHLSRFIHNFHRWKEVSFPKPLYPLVHPSVLVETFEQGDCVSRYINEPEGNAHCKRDLAHIGTHAFLKMLLVDNFIHADMHPGNILVRMPAIKHSRKKFFRAKPHIIFLDVGMTTELSKNDRLNLLNFFKAVATRDGRTAAECTLKLSNRQSCPSPKAFIEELETTFAFWGTPEGDIFHPVECMHELLEQVRRHKVNIDGNVCTVLVTILVLEGWQRKLDPNFDIMRTLRTLLLEKGWAEPVNYFSS